MGKGKKAAKAAAAIIEDPLADAASEEQLLEPQVSEPESSAGPRAGSALDVEELSEGAENSDDDDDEMTEETLKKMFELLGPEELAFLQQETDDAEGNGEEEDDEGESESEQGASGSEEEANSDSEEANVPPPPRSDAVSSCLARDSNIN